MIKLDPRSETGCLLKETSSGTAAGIKVKLDQSIGKGTYKEAPSRANYGQRDMCGADLICRIKSFEVK